MLLWMRTILFRYKEQLPPLQWCHNEHDGISNHWHLDCLHKRLFRHRSQKTSKLRVTGLCEGNSAVTGEFLTQRASNAENVSICWHPRVVVLWTNPYLTNVNLLCIMASCGSVGGEDGSTVAIGIWVDQLNSVFQCVNLQSATID